MEYKHQSSLYTPSMHTHAHAQTHTHTNTNAHNWVPLESARIFLTVLDFSLRVFFHYSVINVMNSTSRSLIIVFIT